MVLGWRRNISTIPRGGKEARMRAATGGVRLGTAGTLHSAEELGGRVCSGDGKSQFSNPGSRKSLK